MNRVEVWREFDLGLSLSVSFTYPLFEKRGSSFVKTYGHRAGAKLRKEGKFLYYSGCSEEEALLLSGAWFNPLEVVKGPRKWDEALGTLLEDFPGLGMSVDPWDPRAIFYAIQLSRNTDYHVNTVKWMRAMAKEARNEAGMKQIDPRSYGRSYQLRQLWEIKKELDGLLEYAEFGRRDEFAALKRKLLRIKYVGPKSVHAYGLFSWGLSELVPADRHLVRFLGELGIRARLPNKALCLRHECWSCPSSDCVVSLLMKDLGVSAGWFQTAIYANYALKSRRRKAKP